MRVACLTAFALLLLSSAAHADGAPPGAALCAVCHGAAGKPVNPNVPVIWGQNEGYLYLELRDYKTGNRKNATMGPIAAALDKPTMKALAAYFAAKDWPNLGQPAAAPEIVQHAESVNSSAACKGCHLDHWQGDSATPRLAGNTKEYLRATMIQFRDGERANNPWMSALLKTFKDDDIDALAGYLAGY